MLVRLRPGAYGINDELSSVEMSLLSDQLPNAFDASAGGAYTLTNPASIGGAFLTISNLIVDGEFQLAGIGTLTGVITVSTALVIDGSGSADVSWTSGATLTGAVGAVGVWSGLWTFNDNVTFNDPVAHNGAVTVSALFTHATGICALTSDTRIGGSFRILAGTTASLETTLSQPAGGGVLYRELIGPDADRTIAANTFDYVTLTGPITADRAYTLSDAPTGTVIHLSMSNVGSGAHFLTLRRGDATTIMSLQYGVSGIPHSCTLIVRAGAWQIHTVIATV